MNLLFSLMNEDTLNESALLSGLPENEGIPCLCEGGNAAG